MPHKICVSPGGQAVNITPSNPQALSDKGFNPKCPHLAESRSQQLQQLYIFMGLSFSRPKMDVRIKSGRLGDLTSSPGARRPGVVLGKPSFNVIENWKQNLVLNLKLKYTSRLITGVFQKLMIL
ncbi:hypothetical protein RRG08_045101 [Elysia crispata]|uniref:Uncharacterized protein n=1 Tax=Elysia crispata TaxID=231223 RepID=A0AAE0YSP0_9GAST|nr:hypothetical protein RRG08_045101 [Elysia crispata]